MTRILLAFDLLALAAMVTAAAVIVWAARNPELDAYAAGWSPARHGGGASWEPGAGTFVGPDEKEVQ